ncbi:hypothetical protein RS86_01583 [Microbacterium azadirachtae]|uniref:Glycosyltransferase RgtA/B/C/D-like domain-containing protein n=2 Tax=Microbacterium azadirachtae TaxID=582680 RepID=A0A0F0LQI8_9MICO|nr:hypothetical protein RS86_01583 [Microbacterium azadirachtae]
MTSHGESTMTAMAAIRDEQGLGRRISVPPRGAIVIAMAAVIAVAGAAAAWLRLPGTARDTLWAEDGRDFLQGAIDSGFDEVFVPYGGYLHVIPRLIAGLAAALPVESMAVAMTAGSCLVAGVCTAVVWLCARQILLPVHAAVVAALTVLAPLAAREVLGNTANLHTLMMWTLLWLLLVTPRRRGVAVVVAVVVAFAALTEIQAVLLIPVALWRVRDPMRRIVLAGLLTGLAAQVAASLLSPRRQTAFGHVEPLSYVKGFVANAVLPLALPQQAIGPALAGHGLAIVVGAAAATLLLLGLLLRSSSRSHRILVAVLLAGAVVIYCGSVYANPEDYYDYARHTTEQLRSIWLPRYGVLPSMLIASAIVVAADGVARARRPGSTGAVRRRALLSRLAVAGVVASMVLHFGPWDTRRSQGPAWTPQVAAARQLCEQDPGRGDVTLEQTLGWEVRVPCDRLGGGS